MLQYLSVNAEGRIRFPQQDSTPFVQQYQKVLDPLYAYDFKTAIAQLESEKSGLHLMQQSILTLHICWWHIVSGYEESDEWLTRYQNSIQQIIGEEKSQGKETDQMDENEKHLIVLNAYLFSARIEFLRGHYINGLTHLRTCIKMIEEAMSSKFNHPEIEFIYGLYNYYYAKAYEDYFLLRPILMQYPKGDTKKGISILKRYAIQGHKYLKVESNYFLTKIYLESEDNPTEALKYVDQNLQLIPNNMIYQYQKAQLLAKTDEKLCSSFCKQAVSNVRERDDLDATTKNHFIQLFESITNEL